MSFIRELKRRNVFKVAAAYIIIGWLIMQAGDTLAPALHLPEWINSALAFFLILGFPLALFFAWAFEMTPDGIKKEKDVDRSQSITTVTGQKLNNAIIGILVLALGYFSIDKLVLDPRRDALEIADAVQVAREETAPPAEPGKADNSIAVLPFANRSNMKDDQFFTDGIHDDLLTQLAKISGLKVTSRTSVMEYRDTTRKIPEIARELGVSTILEGGIQRAGSRIRINAQLIDVSTDEHLWAETFDREMTVENIFDIQSEITRQIVNAVRGELTHEETDVLTQLPTSNLAAYEAYLHARSFLNDPDYSRQKFEAAEPWLEKAVELDPEFALAWALLVRTNAQAIWQGYDDSPERLKRVKNALSKATEFGPFLPETLAARGEYLYRIENNYHEAEIAFRAASEAKPGDANFMKRLAYTQRRVGKWEQAIDSFQKAFTLDPDEMDARSDMIGTLLNIRAFDRAEPLIDAWMEQYPEAMDIRGYKLWLMINRDGDLAAARNLFDHLTPNSGQVYYLAATLLPILERDYQAALETYDNPEFLALYDDPISLSGVALNKSYVSGYMGNQDQAADIAIGVIENIKTIQSGRSDSDYGLAYTFYSLATAYAQAGDLIKALEAANKACALISESRDSLSGTDFSQTRAWILALAGHRDEALLEIERLLSVPSNTNRWVMHLDPAWDFFRDDERFNELIRPLNLDEVK